MKTQKPIISKTPMNVGRLISALQKFSPELEVWVSVCGGSAARPTRVRFGNEYSYGTREDFITIDNGTKDDR